ncbi:hypothetical protein SFRURICE_004172 [Spodoptera frugiperda]|nr:hypothetical protein SFRURICE_004172 [Spodoptera frugiperda]
MRPRTLCHHLNLRVRLKQDNVLRRDKTEEVSWGAKLSSCTPKTNNIRAHPYPSEDQKKQLAQDTGLTILQVNNCNH